MIFENIQFHNVEELERTERGLIMWRVPAQLRQSLNQVAAESSSRYSTGVELRFEIVEIPQRSSCALIRWLKHKSLIFTMAHFKVAGNILPR